MACAKLAVFAGEIACDGESSIDKSAIALCVLEDGPATSERFAFQGFVLWSDLDLNEALDLHELGGEARKLSLT